MTLRDFRAIKYDRLQERSGLGVPAKQAIEGIRPTTMHHTVDATDMNRLNLLNVAVDHASL